MSDRIKSILAKFYGSDPQGYPIENFILRHGRPFAGIPRPQGLRKKSAKMCFQNATLLAFDREDLGYAEGFACSPSDGVPFLHAWCVEDGKAIDPTLSTPEKYGFFGVIFPRPLLHKYIALNKTYGLLSSDAAREIGRKLACKAKSGTCAAGNALVEGATVVHCRRRFAIAGPPHAALRLNFHHLDHVRRHAHPVLGIANQRAERDADPSSQVRGAPVLGGGVAHKWDAVGHDPGGQLISNRNRGAHQ